MNIIKNILKWTLGFVLLIMVLGISLWLFISAEIRHLSGENTPQVDAAQFESRYGNLAITNVNVLSPDAASMLPKRTLLIRGSRIEAVGENLLIPQGYEIIDAGGRFMIPGLIDTHIHPYRSKNDLLLYLANGITHVAIMNSWRGLYLRWREEAQAGPLSPSIYVAAGPMNTARDFRSKVYGLLGPIQLFNTPDETRKAVQAFKQKGYDALKAYTLDKENYFAVANEAQKQDITMLGHLSPAVTLEALYLSGQLQVAHVEEITKAVEREFGGRTSIYYDHTDTYLAYLREHADLIAQKLKAKNITVSSTIMVYPAAKAQDVDLPEYLKSIELAYVNPGILEGSIFSPGWLPGSNRYEDPDNTDPEGLRKANIYWNTYTEVVHITTLALVRHGVRLTVGTDAGNAGIVPVFLKTPRVSRPALFLSCYPPFF
ncbi:hypothetical protein WJR50_29590 [Catalinimonas sp. 4WD22]|uniref:amidohydrolase family protein n=1 Tax=Catalinimonas locisalis TaxID=3133978 RepID=UPI003101B1B4